MLRFTSLAATAALLASTGIALAQMPTYSNERQTQTYSTDRPSYSTERWNGTRSYQQSYESAPSYQHQPMNRTLEMNRFGRSQTERFGTSIAQSLRVYSDDMRIKRRQRAEEMSAKTSVKMVPPLVFFIFPALMVVILGPAVIAIMRQLGPVFNK